MEKRRLAPEQIEKAKACKTPEEILELAKQEGIELTDEQLQQISGGDVWEDIETGAARFEAKFASCPKCGFGTMEYAYKSAGRHYYRCKNCNRTVYDEFYISQP